MQLQHKQCCWRTTCWKVTHCALRKLRGRSIDCAACCVSFTASGHHCSSPWKLHTFWVVSDTAMLMVLSRAVSLQCSIRRGARRHVICHLADACGPQDWHVLHRRSRHSCVSPKPRDESPQQNGPACTVLANRARALLANCCLVCPSATIANPASRELLKSQTSASPL